MTEEEVEIVSILKRSFKSLIEDPGLLGLYLLPYTVFVIASFHMWSVLGTLDLQEATQATSELRDLIVENIWAIILYIAAIVVLGLTAHAAIILRVAARERGRSLGLSTALRRGIGYIPVLFAAGVLVVLISIGPFLIFIPLMIWVTLAAAIGVLVWIIPAIYIAVRFSLYAQACVIKNLGPIGCLGECWRTTEGNFWLIFVTLLLLGIISTVIRLIPVGGSLITSIVVGPAIFIALTLIYSGLSK